MGSIRLLLALAVALYHSYGILYGPNVMTGGMVSVQAFYIISGFYMALILNEKYLPGPGSYFKFLSSRLIRIFPVYWVCLLIVGVICIAGYFFWDQPFYLGYWRSYWEVMTPGTALIFILANLFVVGSDWILFTRFGLVSGTLAPVASPFSWAPRTYSFLLLPQIWTVGVELTFYLLAPWLVRMRWWIQLVIMAASLGLRFYIAGYKGLDMDPWSYRFFPMELAFFIGGSLAYRVYERIRHQPIPNWLPRLLWSGILLLIMFYSSFWYIEAGWRRWIFCSLLLAALPYIFLYTKDMGWDRFLGELSFPVYITHHFIMYLWRQYFWEHLDQVKWFGIVTAISSILFSILLWKVLIRPIEKYRQDRLLKA